MNDSHRAFILYFVFTQPQPLMTTVTCMVIRKPLRIIGLFRRYVGCFDNYPPFDNTGGVLPNPPEKVGTVLLLYTPDNKDVGKEARF